LLQKRWISQTWLIKKADNERIWEERAQEIADGKRRHIMDILEERGLIKDTAGCVEAKEKRGLFDSALIR
jgi:hypothetical protein